MYGTPPKDQQVTVADEYKEVGINQRYWGEVRFKQLTVFVAATGVLAATAITDNVPELGRGHPFLLAGIGTVLAAVFFVLDERATCYRRAYISCLLTLERAPGMLRVYHRTDNPWKLGAHILYRLLFAVAIILWGLYSIKVQYPEDTGKLIVFLIISVSVCFAVHRSAEVHRRHADRAGARRASVKHRPARRLLPASSAPGSPLSPGLNDQQVDEQTGDQAVAQEATNQLP